VFLNRCPEFKSPNIVLTDNFYGAYIAAKHLIEHNYKKIAVIAGPQDISTGKERFQGFKQALDNFGIELLDDYIKIDNYHCGNPAGHRRTLSLHTVIFRVNRMI
jgi:DNA-binding LacI/PurR family transcriptional regulator